MAHLRGHYPTKDLNVRGELKRVIGEGGSEGGSEGGRVRGKQAGRWSVVSQSARREICDRKGFGRKREREKICW